jgi:hypothetical protein
LEQGIIFVEQAIFSAEQGLLWFLAFANGSDRGVDIYRNSTAASLGQFPDQLSGQCPQARFDSQNGVLIFLDLAPEKKRIMYVVGGGSRWVSI